ncbi:MAG: hypothetical protein KBC17_03575, partial [Candidatus Pacebacteria bacterium]|nr:hypothetical protein [Candidatus Paceibacterota bacterium]
MIRFSISIVGILFLSSFSAGYDSTSAIAGVNHEDYTILEFLFGPIFCLSLIISLYIFAKRYTKKEIIRKQNEEV